MKYSKLKQEIEMLELKHKHEMEVIMLRHEMEVDELKEKCTHKYEDESSAESFEGVDIMRYHSGIAQDTLKNNSICIKEGDCIRNIIDEHDIETGLLVFVNNVGVYTIDINTPVRYTIVNLSFR